MKILGVILPALLVAACTHRYSYPPAAAAGDRFTLKTVGRARIRATAEVREGKLVWRSDETGQLLTASDILACERKSHVRGALEGLLIGLAGGALTGAALGLASGDDPPGLISFSAEDKALAGAIGIGLSGALLGGIVGTIAGSTARYEVRPGSEPTISVGAHPRGAAARVSWRF